MKAGIGESGASQDPVDVSVVVPCFRCTETIGRAMDSIRAQTRRPREVILVDDRSDDHTLEVLRGLESDYPELEIRVAALERNQGPSVARNTGWEMARATYLALLDSDDSWHPRKLEIQFRLMVADPGIAITAHPRIEVGEGFRPGEIEAEPVGTPVGRFRLLASNCFPTSSVMMRRDLPYRFREDQRLCEDYLLWLTIILSGHRGEVFDLPLAHTHKAIYGEAGLSGDIRKMDRQVIKAFRHLRGDGLMSAPLYGLVRVWSKLKYFRRVLKLKLRPSGA